jgi:hypothetical protein
MKTNCATSPVYSTPTWTGDPPPGTWSGWSVTPVSARPPSIAEQMGTDPISKLAAAVEKLADALREGTRD